MADMLLLMLDQILQEERAKQKVRGENVGERLSGPSGAVGPDDVRVRGATSSTAVGATFMKGPLWQPPDGSVTSSPRKRRMMG